MKALANKYISYNLFIFLFGIYFLTNQANNSSDQQQVKFETTRSIIEKGDLSLPDGMGVKGKDGRGYSWYGIGQPMLVIPFYMVGKSINGYEGAVVMSTVINQFVVAVSGIIVFLFIVNIGYSKKTALTVTLFYATGTLAWPQSKHHFDHPAEMLFVFLAVFYAHVYLKGGRTRHLLLSSTSLGYAFITRAPAVLALLPICVFLSYSRLEDGISKKRILVALKDCSIYFLSLLPFALIQLWYNYVRFGSIFETGITLMARRAGIDFFTGTPFITGITGFLVSPGKGFFYYSPISILIFFSIRSFCKKNKGLSLCIIGIVSSYLIFLSGNVYWHGDWSWGPRYIFVITPLLMVPIADFVERVFRSEKVILRYAVLLLFAVSIGVQIIGISLDFNRYFTSLQMEEGVRFTIVGGNDVPYIVEPPPRTYFEWDKFPIIYQAGTAINILMGRDNAVFDFWWLRALNAGTNPYLVLLLLVLIFSVIVISWLRVLKLVNE